MMRMTMFLLALATVATGCSSGGSATTGRPLPRNDDVVIDAGDDASPSKTAGPRALKRGAPRSLHVPKGHYPPYGQCRIWVPGTPPGHQAPSAPCNTLAGKVPSGAFVLYNDRAYDANHDWAREKSKRPNTVPDVIVKVTKRDASENATSTKASPAKANGKKQK